MVILVICLTLISSAVASGQTEQEKASLEKESVFDFSDFNPEQWVINEKNTRFIESEDKEGKKRRILRIGKAQKQLSYIRDFEFKNGAIECDLRGGAYLGIAFRIRDGSKYELFYFRPPKVEGWQNTIQYVAQGMKNYNSWEWIRKNHPGRYETGVVPIPANKPDKHWWNDPNPFADEWFHVKVIVSEKEAKVFVNDNKEPSLVVSDLKYGQQSGTVGVYAWRGEFANFKVRLDK